MMGNQDLSLMSKPSVSASRPPRAPFITIEGVDGAGKSSHLPTILAVLQEHGFQVVQTREPGGTPIGEELREMILTSPARLETTVFLAFASRSEHLAAVINPALQAGQAVLCDRFTDSTYAYQGAGNGYPEKNIARLEAMVHPHLQPDLTLLFDLPVDESLRRLSLTSKVPDNFESQPRAYFQRVRDAYLHRAASNDRFIVIDASPSLETVAQHVRTAVAGFLNEFTLRSTHPSILAAPFNRLSPHY